MSLTDALRGESVFSFPGLNKQTFLGLPGLLADSLPDKFGNSIIDVWLARKGREASSFSPIERLCYIGKRGMGALEFHPPYDHEFDRSIAVEVAELVALAQEVTMQRTTLNVNLSQSDPVNAEAMCDILRVGTSAGGARPKAIIAMNADGHVLSGQVAAPAGYDYWILKFDGVTDLELGTSHEFGRIEYAYYLMAKAAGITMMECRLLEENHRAHFMTKRFDRVSHEKIHVQTLCGLAHYDYNQAGAYSYEQAFAIMRKLHLNKAELVQQYRRLIFNVLARNQDDHTKNIAFLMDNTGDWKLSPAYDLTYSHNPKGIWTNQHQMSINGKRDHFTIADLKAVADAADIPHSEVIIKEISEIVADWAQFAKIAGLSDKITAEIAQFHRFNIE